jgi:hypothetical protein
MSAATPATTLRHVRQMIQIRNAMPDDVLAIAQVHVQTDWDTYSALFGPRACKLGKHSVSAAEAVFRPRG